MASVAKGRLSRDKEELTFPRVVTRMATKTAQVVFAMRRARKVHLLFARDVALQAALVNFSCGLRFEAENLIRVTRVADMFRACPMAGFASLFGWAAALIEHGPPVRGFVNVVVDIFVASLAG